MILGYFSTVGLLFFWNQTRIISQYPEIKPLYNDPNLSPYNGHFDILGNFNGYVPFEQKTYKGNTKIYRARSWHTLFSHYYCLEKDKP
jgi:hypothetical protein